MGTDNLFHKRKAKKTTDLQRKHAHRAAYKKLLIVCEGEKAVSGRLNERTGLLRSCPSCRHYVF